MIYSFTDKAEKDLERILDFTLIHWGQRKAIEYLNGIELLAVKLSENPSIGIERPELATSIRSFPYESHTLYYTSINCQLIITRVLHTSMDPLLHLE